MEDRTGRTRTAFVANLISPRTVLIFMAGFLLALLSARMLPSAELFHPEGRIHTKDIVITLLNGQTLGELRGIATEEGESFGGRPEVWDGDLLQEAFAHLDSGDYPLALPARITYVVPREGIWATIRIGRRD
ncbi:MAG: hypothetical protein WEB06_00135 [Actinomycetota bacterium]